MSKNLVLIWPDYHKNIPVNSAYSKGLDGWREGMPGPLPMSGIRDNHTRGNVAEFLKSHIQEGSQLSVVSAFFTIYAYEARISYRVFPIGIVWLRQQTVG
jgi:hypothetical protein